jgi:hypothetical protein
MAGGKSESSIWASFIYVAKMAGFLLLVVGVVHAYILPMMPYVIFLFFVSGMIILIAEALIAAPLWAFFHVRMDGGEFVDQVQRPGYMIAFNLFLRPTLAIFGLIASFSVFSASVWFMNETFGLASSIASGTGNSALRVVIIMVLMTYLHWQLAVRSFALINQVPDRVTRWFGQAGENLGEENDANRTTAFFVGQAEDRMRAAGGATAGRGARTTGAAATGSKVADGAAGAASATGGSVATGAAAGVTGGAASVASAASKLSSTVKKD